MDNKKLYENIIKQCRIFGEPPTVAARNAGIGKDVPRKISEGKSTSVANIADLAAYLGVTTSDLVGDKVEQLPELPPDLAQLSDAMDALNDEGRERLLEYADDLVQTGKYKKADPHAVDQKKIV